MDGYNAMGLALANGEGFEGLFRTPGYPLFLAGVYSLFGNSQFAVKAIQILLTGTIPLGVYLLARRFLSHGTAILCSFAAAIGSVHNLVYATTIYCEGLASSFFVWSIVCLLMGVDRKRPGFFLASGLMLGYLALIRPGYGLLSIFLTFGVLVSESGKKSILTGLAVFNVAMMAVLSTWGLFNYVRNDRFVFLSSEGGLLFLAGVCETGAYKREKLYLNPDLRMAEAVLPERLGKFIVESGKTGIRLDLGRLDLSSDRQARLYTRVRQADGSYRSPFTSQVVAADKVMLPTVQNGETLEYYLETIDSLGHKDGIWPPYAPASPAIFTFSANLLGDVDTYQQVVDIFDLARVALHVAQIDSLRRADIPLYDANADSRVDITDLRAIKVVLGNELDEPISPGNLESASSSDTTFLDSTPSQLHVVIGVSDTISIRLPFPENLGGIEPKGNSAWGIALNDLFLAIQDIPSLEPDDNARHHAQKTIEYGTTVEEKDYLLNKAFFDYSLEVIRKTGWTSYVSTVLKRTLLMYITSGHDPTDFRLRRQFAGAKVLYPIISAYLACVLILALAGVFLTRADWRKLFPYYAVLLYFPLTHSFFHVEARYSSAVQPFLLMFAMIGLIALFSRRNEIGEAKKT